MIHLVAINDASCQALLFDGHEWLFVSLDNDWEPTALADEREAAQFMLLALLQPLPESEGFSSLDLAIQSARERCIRHIALPTVRLSEVAHLCPADVPHSVGSYPHSKVAMVIGIDFGTSRSGFAWGLPGSPNNIHIHTAYEDQLVGYPKTLTAILLAASGNIRAWGYPAFRDALCPFRAARAHPETTIYVGGLEMKQLLSPDSKRVTRTVRSA